MRTGASVRSVRRLGRWTTRPVWEPGPWPHRGRRGKIVHTKLLAPSRVYTPRARGAHPLRPPGIRQGQFVDLPSPPGHPARPAPAEQARASGTSGTGHSRIPDPRREMSER
ncbi:hypothetical protein [Prauserella marina]|uniref:hypothetical protein n=1 Tax=Prauserella marina TaxID=530584 RepID=UPI003B847433